MLIPQLQFCIQMIYRVEFFGFGPNMDYDPSSLGDGTKGGLARLATLLKRRKIRTISSRP